MQLDYAAILVASVLQFIFGAIWYTPVFGKKWGEIHGFDKVAPEKQKEMMKRMWKLLLAQFVVTVVTSAVFNLLLQGFPADWNVYGLAGFFWLGFVFPTQISAVLFGGTEPKWVATKIAISGAAGLICLEIAAAVFVMMR